MKLEQDSYLPLRDVVFNALRDAILKGELHPGERLMETHLADTLGVSRTPIREAIRMLEKEGLALTIPRRGAQVAQMSEKDLEDVLEVRDALDALAVKEACERITSERLSALEVNMKQFEKAVEKGDIREIADADEAFHAVIYDAADNPKLASIVQNLREQMYRYRYEYLKDKAYHALLIKEHKEIYDGLKAKDRENVKDAMHRHLENQIDAVRQVIQEQSK
ncbi:MAG: GntR family transcriptional regulator [Lachnospiraceae bacterium]|nr:GntR family transcriptional regulator [Lachnospiraceae bacterium]